MLRGIKFYEDGAMKNPERTTRVAYILEAGFEYFISIFVTGTMLGYLLDTLGFSDAVQGIISTVATFTCGAQLFALVISGRAAKRISTIGHIINQACFAVLYFLPLFDIPSSVKSVILIVLLFAGHIIGNALMPNKTVWLMSAVPNEKRGSFTAIKEMVSLAGGIAVSLVMGAIADTYRSSDGLPTSEYYVICTVALIIMTVIHTVTLLVSTEKEPVERKRVPIVATVKRMFSRADLIKVILVGIIWNIASGFSASFFASYLREELAFTFTIISLITTIGSICRIVVSPLIGKIADKYSFSFSMTLSFCVVAVGFLCVCFTTPETRWLYLGYSCMHSFAMAGINSGVINLIYDYVAPEDRAVALGVKNALGGIIGFLAALVSGAILENIQASGGLEIFGLNLYAQQVLAFMSLVVTVLLIIYMRVVIRPLHRVDAMEDADAHAIKSTK